MTNSQIILPYMKKKQLEIITTKISKKTGTPIIPIHYLYSLNALAGTIKQEKKIRVN